MKQFITIIIVAVMCMSLFGCATNKADVDATPVTVATEPAAPTEVDISQFPDAKEFDVFEWPTLGISTSVPVPMWSNRGRALIDSEDKFWGQVGYATVDNYNDYVKACQEAGFITNYFVLVDTIYYGENSEGHGVFLVYSKYEQFVDIKVLTDTSEIDKWWENE